MPSARTGLKRAGIRGYHIEGPLGLWRIERDRPGIFYVAREPILRPAGLFALKFNRLTAARRYAEEQAGLTAVKTHRSFCG